MINIEKFSIFKNVVVLFGGLVYRFLRTSIKVKSAFGPKWPIRLELISVSERISVFSSAPSRISQLRNTVCRLLRIFEGKLFSVQ